MQNTSIHVILSSHTLEFLEFEGQLIIRMQSLDHSTKGQTKLNADIITQLSNGLLEGSRDVIEWINSIKNQNQNFEILENNLRINFKYMLGQKEKLKTIIFPLVILIIDDITILKLENSQLKNKISKLQNQVVSLRQQFTYSLASIDQRIKTFKWEEIYLDSTNAWEPLYDYDYRVFINNECFFGYLKKNWITQLIFMAGKDSYTIYSSSKKSSPIGQVHKIQRRRKEI